MEMWRNRTPFRQKRVLKGGRPTTATVHFVLQGTDSDANPSWQELKDELEVAMPDGGSVVLRGLFNGHKKMSPFVLPGMQVPVKLRPRRRPEAGPVESAPPQQMVSAGEPAGGGWQAQTIKAWQDAVASGHMSQEDYEQALADLRAAGG